MPSVIANERGSNHCWKQWCVHWIVVYACIAISGTGVNYLQHRATEGESPVCDPHILVYGVHCSSNVPLDWNANGCEISSKYWHMSETDRKHVPWGSCEKNFENIVIRTWPRCSSMDIVCGYGKIVMGTGMHDCLTSVRCVCTTWCIFLCMQTSARCIIQGLTRCSHAPVWRMRLVRYCIGHYTQFAAVRNIGYVDLHVVRWLCWRAHAMHVCVYELLLVDATC